MRDRSAAKYDLLVVVPRSGWTPENFVDEPYQYDVHWVDAQSVDRATAEGILFGFNSAAMADCHKACKAWMIARPTIESIESGVRLTTLNERAHCHE